MNANGQGRKPTLKSDAQALKRAPQPLKHLDKYAKDEWRRVMPFLIERQIVTKADMSGVETYCAMVGIIRTVEQNRSENDGVINVPMFGVMNRAATTARQLAAEFGLTPVSRAKLGGIASDDDDADNPLAV